jgi:hypothetical protein
MSYPLLSTVYATDENILIRAAGDFAVLCPEWQKLASGVNGVIGAASPWELTSASVDFLANGVRPGHVVVLRKPAALFKGSGEPFAVDAVATGAVTLRRPGRGPGAGQPPPATADVDFLIASLDPQIEEASFDLNRRFAIDPTVPCRSPSAVYDLRDLRTACVVSVLAQRYAAETRGRDGDFPIKLTLVKQELSDVLARLQIRWGLGGDAQPPSTQFSTRLVR